MLVRAKEQLPVPMKGPCCNRPVYPYSFSSSSQNSDITISVVHRIVTAVGLAADELSF